MDYERQRIAIADYCGWNGVKIYFDSNKWWGRNPKSKYSDLVPDYPNDLNAMHDAEKSLTEKQWKKYPVWLAKVIAGTQNKSRANGTRVYVPQSCLLAANAPQKAEAFLRTIGKWEE